MISTLWQWFCSNRFGFSWNHKGWLCAAAACALLGVGCLTGYLVGLVDTKYAPLSAAPVWPVLQTGSLAEAPPEVLRGLFLPKLDRAALPPWRTKAPTDLPPADFAGRRLPTALVRHPRLAEARPTGEAAINLPPSDNLVSKIPLAHLPPMPRQLETDGPLARLSPDLARKSALAPGQAKIAIVIDDLGLVQKATRKMIALDPGLTLAFLPYGHKSGALAAEAHAAGHEVLLHMPMEPNSHADPGPDALLTVLEANLIRSRLRQAFERIPQAIGLNNHMGSRFTSNAYGMAVVLDELGARGMMVLDSVTSPNSVVTDLARARGVPSEARDVFLDNNRDVTLINQQLDELERIARAVGSAVAIGHPYQETIAALRDWLPGAYQRGLELVPLSQLAKPSLSHPMIAASLPQTTIAAR